MKKIFKSFIIILSHLLLFPHLVLYLVSKEKNNIDKDIKAMSSHCDVSYSGTMGLVYFLLRNKFYRNIFYSRIGSPSKICSWYIVEDKTFYASCKNIGGGVYPAHPVSTFLGAKSIGKNFSFRNSTTIGNVRDGENDKSPIIEDDVTLGANVCIVGNIVIGRGAVIGAGAAVRNSLPPYSIAIGNPAKIVGFRFRPSDIIDYEIKIYPEDQRLPLDYLENNYKKYYLERLKDIKGIISL